MQRVGNTRDTNTSRGVARQETPHLFDNRENVAADIVIVDNVDEPPRVGDAVNDTGRRGAGLVGRGPLGAPQGKRFILWGRREGIAVNNE